MKKISIDDVEQIILDTLDDEVKEQELIKAIRERMEDEPEKEKAERKKYEVVILSVKEDGEEHEQEYLRYLFKVEEGSDHNLLAEGVRSAIRDHNITARNAKSKVSDLVQGIEKIAKKKFKENTVLEAELLSRSPSITVLVDNTI